MFRLHSGLATSRMVTLQEICAVQALIRQRAPNRTRAIANYNLVTTNLDAIVYEARTITMPAGPCGDRLSGYRKSESQVSTRTRSMS